MNALATHVTSHSEAPYYFRSADHMRLQACVHALSHEGQNLTLCCEEEALLDHYAQLLLSDVRTAAPQQKIEVYFPTSPDSLVERFNEALATLSVDEASSRDPSRLAGQIWVIHDPTVLADHEVHLLGKLIHSLPGANIRLVLLLAGTTARDFNIPSLKKRMLRWDIDQPTPEQALAALEFSEHSGQLSHLRRLLNKICSQDPEAAASAQALSHPPMSDFQPVALHPVQAAVQPESTPQVLDEAAPMPPQHRFAHLRGQGLKISAVVIAALGVSTAMMMWTQPQAFGLASPTSDSVAPTKARNQAGSEVEITELKETPKPSAKPKYALGKNKPEALEPGALQAPAALQAPLTQAASQTVQPATVPKASAGKPEAANRATTSPTRFTDLGLAAQWLKTLPPQAYLIWYATSVSLEEAQAIQKKYPSLATSVIVTTYKPNQTRAQFTVVSETFESAGKAYLALKSATYPTTVWVRQVKDVQQELNASSGSDRRN